jgi:hypothetical protein
MDMSSTTAQYHSTGFGMFLCARCHLRFRAQIHPRGIGYGAVHTCGKYCSGVEIRGREGKQDCNDKCMGSKSGICECRCAGKNHGGAR